MGGGADGVLLPGMGEDDDNICVGPGMGRCGPFGFHVQILIFPLDWSKCWCWPQVIPLLAGDGDVNL